jgi:hypothetical protein
VLALLQHPFAVPLWGIVLGAALIGIGFWKGERPGPLFRKDTKTGKR